MTTPSIAELLVQQAKEAERLRLMLQDVNRLAAECKDLAVMAFHEALKTEQGLHSPPNLL